MNPQERINKALELIREIGAYDGSHHKQYCLDQVLRILLQDEYDQWIIDYKAGEDGPETYEWEIGIAP